VDDVRVIDSSLHVMFNTRRRSKFDVRSKYSESHAFVIGSLGFAASMNRQHKGSSTEHAVIVDRRK
jgi:hypothetical protein